MTAPEPMDHAAAHERIEDLLLEPARLAALPGSTDPDDAALREHLAGCPGCAADLEAWQRVQVAVDRALPGEPGAAAAAVEPVELPSSLRGRVLDQIRTGVEPAAPLSISGARSARRRRLGWLVGLAAGIGVLLGTGAFAAQQLGERAAAEAQARELAAALEIVDRMLATDHKVVQLRTTAGERAGTISWSRHDWVVLTTALEPPPAGQEYLCWLESNGRSVPVGHMEFAGGTAYWVATLDEWQTWEIGPTTQFVVTLEPAGARIRSGPPILEALLAG
jgi:hypothetical protein